MSSQTSERELFVKLCCGQQLQGNTSPVPYFLGYKIEFFSFQNNPKNLGPSYKMDLDLWDCLGRVQHVL